MPEAMEVILTVVVEEISHKRRIKKMPEKIITRITREMLTIATHKTSGKGHYVLKSEVMTNVKTVLRSSAMPLCGLFQIGQAHQSLHVITPATVTCQRCIQAFKKHEEANELKEVKMLETSDGKTFPLKARKAALKHEDELNIVKKQDEFIDAVIETLFTEGGKLDEDLVSEFEEDLGDAMQYLGATDITEFLKSSHEMLQKHGRRIRSMLILYQKIHGNLVPCRNTMEKMRDAGIYL
jgi:hypothetical protein